MMDTGFTSHRGFSEQLRRNVAFQRPADPVEQAIDGGFEPVFPHVAPSVQEEVPVGFEPGELDALVRFEAVPEVRAAVAHYLHLPLVFLDVRHGRNGGFVQHKKIPSNRL